jgi:hypothetical protein
MLNRLREVFSSFQKHKVKYVVIGGIAAVLHGVPRATFALDILIDPTVENARRLLDALLEAKLGTAALINENDMLAHEITVFRDRVRIDVHTSTPGIQFDSVWDRREIMDYQGIDLYVVSKEDLISSKKAAGRPVDLEDVRLLTIDQSESSEEDNLP